MKMNRRQFIGVAAGAAGAAMLASEAGTAPLRAAESEADAWPKRTPVKIHKIFVGRTGGIYLSRPTEEVGRLNEHLAKVQQRLGDVEFVGGDFVPTANMDKVLADVKQADAVIMFHLSGHGGDAPQKAMQQIIDLDLPTAIFSQPYSGHGWMYFPQWQKAGKKVVLLATSDWSELDRIAAVMRVGPHMRRSKVLVVGGPLGTAPACSPEKVRERLGTTVTVIPNDRVIEAHKAVDPKAAEAEAEEYWLSKAKRIVEPTRDEIINSARMYLAVKDLMIKEGAQAVTSSHCMGAPAKGCLTFSKLNDLGLVGACEGDIDSTLTMLMFTYAFGVPGFISDPVFDTARNALIHFHCTSATKMDGPGSERLPFSIRTQTDSGRGVALEVENRVGQVVTCAKFIDLQTMLISTGKIIEVTHNPLGCRTQLVTEVKDARSMFHNWGAGILKGGVMTLLHRVVFYGDRMQDVRNLGSLMGFNVVEEA